MSRTRPYLLVLLLMLNSAWVGGSASSGAAQDGSQFFPETGQSVSGEFLLYWQNQGGLAQQGYPISPEFTEISSLDNTPYTVQYFERAVFERHPENAGTPFEVLLSQLGTYRYQAKYGAGGAPAQHTSTDNPRLFTETGKTVGGKFRTYWETHGGLAQQGYPISDEFTEASDLEPGKSYTVQYFERAVFELHPENAATPYEVLLTQLGTLRYQARYLQPTPAPAPTTVPIVPSTATPALPGPTPTLSIYDCEGIPPSQNMVVTPSCGSQKTTFHFIASGFMPGEEVSIWATKPNGELQGAPFVAPVGGEGLVTNVRLLTNFEDPPGIWATTMEGRTSHRQAIGYFKLTKFVP